MIFLSLFSFSFYNLFCKGFIRGLRLLAGDDLFVIEGIVFVNCGFSATYNVYFREMGFGFGLLVGSDVFPMIEVKS